MKKIYIVQSVDFYDGYWGFAWKVEKAFQAKEDAEKYREQIQGDSRIIEVELDQSQCDQSFFV